MFRVKARRTFTRMCKTVNVEKARPGHSPQTAKSVTKQRVGDRGTRATEERKMFTKLLHDQRAKERRHKGFFFTCCFFFFLQNTPGPASFDITKQRCFDNKPINKASVQSAFTLHSCTLTLQINTTVNFGHMQFWRKISSILPDLGPRTRRGRMCHFQHIRRGFPGPNPAGIGSNQN